MKRKSDSGAKRAPEQADHKNNNSKSRRRFLGQFGTMTMAAGIAGLPPLSGDKSASPFAQHASKRDLRAEKAMLLREQAAQIQRKMPLAPQPVNGDEELYSKRIASYSKGLPHNELGEVDLKAYELLLQALSTSKSDDYEHVPLGGLAKLANPQAAMAFEMEGADPHHLSTIAAPAFGGAEQAGEMVELYWQAITRDVHFQQYGDNQLTSQAAVDISALSRFKGPKLNDRVTPAVLFRGSTPGDLAGPFLSQFLWAEIPYGAMNIEQRYRVPQAENDHMTEYSEWLNIQNGTNATSNWLDDQPRYLRNGRDLAAYIRKDFSYQTFLNAALILLGWGQPAIDPYNPYLGSATQGAFCTFGGPYVLDLVARVANAALKACWYQKWQIHRRLRPEEFGGRIHNHLTRASNYPIDAEVLNSSALEIIYEKNDTYLLPQVFPEGCPTHPAYPAGHSTVAGACVTVLKAFFNENFVIPNPAVSNEDGLLLTPYQNSSLKVGGELNKLAWNISTGRNFAGIHWRSDGTEGLKLGENVALSILSDLKSTCHENFKGFRLTRFDGTAVVV